MVVSPTADVGLSSGAESSPSPESSSDYGNKSVEKTSGIKYEDNTHTLIS